MVSVDAKHRVYLLCVQLTQTDVDTGHEGVHKEEGKNDDQHEATLEQQAHVLDLVLKPTEKRT